MKYLPGESVKLLNEKMTMIFKLHMAFNFPKSLKNLRSTHREYYNDQYVSGRRLSLRKK